MAVGTWRLWKASRAVWGLSADTEVKSQWVWQVSLRPLLHVDEKPARTRPPLSRWGLNLLVWWVVDWDTPPKKQQRMGP